MVGEVSNLEADAEATRDRIASTVDDLQHRLSPQTLVHKAFEGIGTQSADVMASVQKFARGNPIGLVAASLVIGLIALARSRSNSAKLNHEKLDAFDDRYEAKSVESAENQSQSHKLQKRRQQHTASRPLIALAIAAGIGALLGGLLPDVG